jgi:hypothetical protein
VALRRSSRALDYPVSRSPAESMLPVSMSWEDLMSVRKEKPINQKQNAFSGLSLFLNFVFESQMSPGVAALTQQLFHLTT